MTMKEKLQEVLGREPVVLRTMDGMFLVEYMNWNLAQSRELTEKLKGDTEDDAIEKMYNYILKAAALVNAATGFD